MKKALVLLHLFFFSACSGQITINPRGCKTEGFWGSSPNSENGKVFKFENNFWMGPDEEGLKLKKLLESDKINCARVKTLSIISKASWSDALFSLIPFVSRKTILLEGELKQAVLKTENDEEEEESGDDEDGEESEEEQDEEG